MLNIFSVGSILGSHKARIKCYKVLKHMLNLKRPKNPEPGTTDPKKLLLWTPTNTFTFTHAVVQMQSVGLALLGIKYMHMCSKNEDLRFEITLLGIAK